MTTSQVIILGRCERWEFAEPYRQCTEMLEEIGARAGGVSPPLFIFFQSYPREFPDLAQLRRENPFAPFFFILGACCEGMLRTAGPLDSPFYRYVHGWSGQDTEQIRLFLTDQPSIFSLPLTAESDEIAQWVDEDSRRQTADGSRGATVPLASAAVCGLPSAVLILTHFGPFGNDSAINQLLADEQRKQGFAPEFCCGLPSADCRLPILADADDSPPEKILETIQRLRRRFADNDFTVYVDSPRFDEKNAYIQAGVTRVLPKIR